MKKLTWLAAALATMAGLLLAPAAPAAATPSTPDYGVKVIKDGAATYGSAHVQWISGQQWDIAVNDSRYDGRNVCVRIQPSEAAAIDYCDTNGSGNTAVHYRIYYPWYQAKVCVGSGGGWAAFCESYITRSIYDY